MTDLHLNAIDLFAGAGGFSLGAQRAGFNVLAAVEHDPVHARTYAQNFPSTSVLCTDVRELTGHDLLAHLPSPPTIHLVIGGPPCQGFSSIGQRDPRDPRNELLLEMARLVGDIRPVYFVLENVPGLLGARGAIFRDRFCDAVTRAGYSLVTPLRTLNASCYGVPQHRRRAFILGYRDAATPLEYPPESRSAPPAVWDAIRDLLSVEDHPASLVGDVYTGPLGKPSPYARALRRRKPQGPLDTTASRKRALTGCSVTSHSPLVARRFASTAPGQSEPVSRYPRLEKDGLSPTLRAGTGRERGSFTAPRPIHPTRARCITVREGARLQSFPDWFGFDDTKWHGFRQVGNAVPPLLAQAVCQSIRSALNPP